MQPSCADFRAAVHLIDSVGLAANAEPPLDCRSLAHSVVVSPVPNPVVPRCFGRPGTYAACLLAGLCALAGAQVPTLTLESLPRPATPPAEAGPVVPAQVQRWRQEAADYEHGVGVPRDPVRAAQLYCRAARYGDPQAQYSLGWMLTNARGIERDDAQAAHLFAAAAEQGIEQARNMLATMGAPRGAPPDCLRPPETDPTPAVARAGAPRARGNAPLAPSPAPSNAPEAIVRFVNLIAPEYQLAPQLVLAVMATESNFDPWRHLAEEGAGADAADARHGHALQGPQDRSIRRRTSAAAWPTCAGCWPISKAT